MIKKFTFLMIALFMGISSSYAQETLYLLTAKSYTGPWETSDSDPAFTYNAATGFYEGVTFKAGKGQGTDPSQAYPNAFKFYTKGADGQINIIGAHIVTAVDFTLNNPYVATFEVGSSAFRINKFYDPKSTEGEVSLSVNLTEGILIANQTDAVDIVPDAIYLWGSIDGGQTNNLMATLLATEANPYVFTTLFDVPYVPGPFVYDSPEFAPSEEDAPDNGFMFMLTPEGVKLSQSSVIVFLAPIGGRTMAAGETEFSIKLARKVGGSIIDQSPGLTEITFNYETLELTLNNKVPLQIPGGSGVESIIDGESTVEFYNLQGQKVNNPDRGVFIKVANGKAVKVVL